ncbi:MAG: glutathione S-transferase family protein [Gammaproteobacteria bacterium]|jgi:GST-like protein
MLELYHWEPNAESAKVMLCLKEKGVEFKSHYVNILELEQYSKDFLAINPAGQVPVLVHDGKILTDSTLITEYIEEAFPEPVLAPHDGKGWYETLCWGKYVEYNLDTSVSTLGWHQVMAPKMAGQDQDKLRKKVAAIPVPERKAAWEAAVSGGYGEEQLENSRRKIGLAVKRIEETLAGSAWLMGNAYTIVDIDAFSLLCTLPRLLPDTVNAGDTPGIMAWLQRINERPAVQETLAMRKTGENAYAPGPEHSRWG